MGIQDDDGDVIVNFELRNPEGTNNEVQVKQHLLGINGYILIRGAIDGDDTIFNVEASHTDLDDLLTVSSILISTIEQHKGIAPLEDRLREVLEGHYEELPSGLIEALVEAVEA